MNYKGLVMSIILLVGIGGIALAELEPEKDKEDIFDLGKIVITPLRLYQKYGQVSRSTDLITEKDIQDKNPTRMGDLLEDLPSAHLIQYGSLGHLSNIKFRGTESNQNLILIDDMPINNPRDGSVNLSDYSTENIDRIEVVRGPSSSLYGSSAVGATVNIITKEGKTAIPKTIITAKRGTYRTLIEEITNSAKINFFDYFISANNSYSEGSRANSKYESNGATAKIGLDLKDKHRFSLSSRWQQSSVGSPGMIGFIDLDDKLETDQDYINGIWESKFGDLFRLKLQGYTNSDRLEWIEAVYPTLDKVTHHTKNHALNVQTSFVLFKNYALMAGLEGKKYLLDSSQAGKHDYITRSAYGLADLKFFEIIELIGGSRVDDYSTFGTHWSPSANASITIGSWKLRGLAARSYRAPTFNDLYWPTEEWLPESLSFLWPIYGRGAKGNPAITPEKGKTYEVGIDNVSNFFIKDFPIDTLLWITFFQTDMEDLISWMIDNTDYYWKPFNVGSARIRGTELEGKVVIIKDIESGFNYTHLSAKDTDTKRRLPYRPKDKFDFSLKYRFPLDITGIFRGEYVSRTFGDSENNISIKPYWIFGLDLYYDIDKFSRYFINIDNLFNRTYEKVKGYPMPGFSIMCGIRVKF